MLGEIGERADEPGMENETSLVALRESEHDSLKKKTGNSRIVCVLGYLCIIMH